MTPAIPVLPRLAVLAGISVLASLALACAMPFVALAALAALTGSRREAVLVTAGAWLANQFVGYGLLAYPQTWDSFGWGAALGIAAIAATLAAGAVAAKFVSQPRWLAWLAAFAAAFVVFEGLLLAATGALPSGGEAFSPATVAYVLQINLLAFLGLAAAWVLSATLYRLAPGTQSTSAAP